MGTQLEALIQSYAKHYHLTDRESEVFYHLVNRVINPNDIGKILNISLYTVNNHLKKILEKTKVDSKTELLADFLLYMEQNRQIELPENLKPKVLIIDDEQDLVEMLKEFFLEKKIECHVFNDARTALEALKKLKIDVIISDIHMPNMNGVEFLKELRKIHHYEPGVIFISGHAGEFDTVSLLDLGAFAFLEKPLDPEKLHRLVWEYVSGLNPNEKNAGLQTTIGNLALHPKKLGFGGFFVEKSQVSASNAMEPGAKVEVKFQLPEKPIHTAICEVVWKRLEGKASDGYGLRFVDLNQDVKQELLEYVRANNILSFIPSCI